MPKDKHSRYHRSRSGHCSYKRKRKHREISRDSSPRSRSSRDTSRNSLSPQPSMGKSLTKILEQIFEFMRLRSIQIETGEVSGGGLLLPGITADIPPLQTILSTEIKAESDGQTVLMNLRRRTRYIFSLLRRENIADYPIWVSHYFFFFSRVRWSSFIWTQDIVCRSRNVTRIFLEEGETSLVNELFGKEHFSTSDTTWDPIILRQDPRVVQVWKMNHVKSC